jgi:hypothetical protein
VAGRRATAIQGDDLLRAYETYDQHVDVVSILHWVFTESVELPSTVRHFERFPSISVRGKRLTPDFTVLFHDGTAIIGEVASLALHQNSVDKLVSQLANYAAITRVPASATTSTNVSYPDVLLFVPNSRGLTAMRRIHECINDSDHDYQPTKPPVVAQYAKGDSEYTLQRLPDPRNGVLSAGNRTQHLGLFLDSDFTAKAEHFASNKVAYRFINDSPATLYLTTHLVLQTLPTQYFSDGEQVEVKPADLAELLRSQYGGGIRSDHIKQALELLQHAGYALDNRDGTWAVSLKPLRSRTESDVPRVIVEKALKRAKSVIVPRERPAEPPDQGTLFVL